MDSLLLITLSAFQDFFIIIWDFVREYFTTPEGLVTFYTILLQVFANVGFLKNTFLNKSDRILAIGIIFGIGLLAVQFGLDGLQLKDFITIVGTFLFNLVMYEKVLEPKGILKTPNGVEKAG